MSGWQRFFKAVFPQKWFEAAEASSRAWMVRCPCGAEKSVWDMGGVRWKARGKSWWLMRCPSCGQRRWHTVERVDAAR
jgi:hypothetical protein